MKGQTTLLAALLAASPTLLLATAPATTGTAPGPGAAHEDAWFQKLDTSKDGAISKEEAQAAADQRIANTFEKLDANHDGLITQAEVTASREARRAEMQAQAAERFKQADTNGDGLLSKDEVSKGMPRLARAFDRLDTNKDGELSPEELQAGRQMMGRRGDHWRHGGPPPDSGDTPAPTLK